MSIITAGREPDCLSRRQIPGSYQYGFSECDSNPSLETRATSQPADVRLAKPRYSSGWVRCSMGKSPPELVQLALNMESHYCKQIPAFSGCVLGLCLELAHIAPGKVRNFEFDDRKPVPDLPQATQNTNQICCGPGALNRFGAIFGIHDDPAKRVFIADCIRRIDLPHRAFSSRAIHLVGCGIGMNLSGRFPIKTLQFAEWREKGHFMSLAKGR